MADTGEMAAALKLDFEQRQRANLIAESRGIDLDTAFELVYLRAQSAAVDEVASAFSDAVGVLKNCTCQQVDVEVLKRIRAALAAVEQMRKEQSS